MPHISADQYEILPLNLAFDNVNSKYLLAFSNILQYKLSEAKIKEKMFKLLFLLFILIELNKKAWNYHFSYQIWFCATTK